jgi:plastocyanin
MGIRFAMPVSMLSLVVLAGASALGAAPAAAAESQTLTIGVDNISPAKENFGFLDYYPRAGVKVHNGDVLGFHFTPPATSDEIHTATLGTTSPGTSESAGAIFGAAQYANPVPDFDDPVPGPVPQLQFSNNILFATNPPAFVPGGCGTQAQPCTYDGRSEINSGILCNGACPNSEYFYKISVPNVPESGLTVHYVCLIHGPTMSGTFTIVPADDRSSTQKKLNAAAREQFEEQTDAGFDAKESALKLARKTGQLIAGAEDPSGHVQVLEMLPQNFEVATGRSLTWFESSLNEIHTVTFPAGHGSDSVDPLPLVCEAGQGVPDTAANTSGVGPPCANPADIENHLNPQMQGVFTISSPTDVGSSGIISSIPGFPAPPTFTFTFSAPGTFTYQCRIHDHMRGTIQVGAEGIDD